MTPAGLLAVGGMVSGILLSVAALVWTATSVRRHHPIANAWRRR
jgi:tetrahydromethanopterin S-methyltransferase subunit C